MLKMAMSPSFQVYYVIQIDDYGIDWDGPVGTDDDSTVNVDNVSPPINNEQQMALQSLITALEDDSYFDIDENSWCRQYCAAKEFVNNAS